MSRTDHKRQKLRRALVLLQRMYGARVWKRRGSGLDLLVEAMLAQNTNMANAARGYRMLRRAFPTWADVLAAPVGDVQRCITICGLARMRARRLQDLLAAVKADRGRLSIEFLGREPTGAAFDYLMQFHGIGPKTAAFTLLFAFGHPVLPVDNGILRVLRRLRLVRAKARDLEVERLISPLIGKGRHYPMHVLTFQHAKARCRPKNAKCHDCLLREVCPHGQRRVRHAPPEKHLELKPPGRMRPVILSRFASDGVVRHREKD